MKQPRFPAPFLLAASTKHLLTIWCAEAEAATEANVLSILVDRPGNAPLSEESKARFHVIQRLTDLP
jgi:hypothetical protein